MAPADGLEFFSLGCISAESGSLLLHSFLFFLLKLLLVDVHIVSNTQNPISSDAVLVTIVSDTLVVISLDTESR